MKEAIERFSVISGYDIQSFIDAFASFTENHYTKIIHFYSGRATDLQGVAEGFRKLNYLINEVVTIKASLQLNKDAFKTFTDWDFYDVLEDAHSQLITIANTSKWARSSTSLNGFTEAPTVTYLARQNQSLEQIARQLESSSDPQNEWTQIALQNDLPEEGYRASMNYEVQLNFKNRPAYFLEGVADNMEGEKMYGKDIDRVLTFEDEDLKSLTYQETVHQSIDILVKLKRNDIPQFPEMGIQGALFKGTNIGSIAFPSLFRQLYSLFKTDDTFASIKVKTLEVVKDGIYVEFEVQTKLQDIILNSATI